MAGAKKTDAASIQRKILSGSAQEWIAPRGSMRVDRVARNAIVFEPKGFLEEPFVELFEESVDDAIKEGKPHLFWDGTAMSGYESAYRLRLGKYCVRVKERVASMNVFAPQPMVAMGAAVINIWLGGFFTMHKTRDELMKTLAKVKASSRS